MRKKLFAVIMSAMMMITFMPTMAFAGSNNPDLKVVNWASDFSSVTVTYKNADGSTYKTTVPADITFATADATDVYAGQYVATADFSGNQKLSEVSPALSLTAYFYDLSKVVFTNDMKYAEMNASTFSTLFGLTDTTTSVKTFATGSIKFVDTPKKGSTPAVEATNDIKGYDLKIAKPAYDSTKTFENQVFEGLQAYVESASAEAVMDGEDKDHAAVINDIPVKKITVTGKTPALADVKFSIDKFDATGNAINAISYDGKEHSIINNNIPTTSVTKYELLNPKTGKYEEVTSPVVKDARAYNFRIYVKVGDKEPALATTNTRFTVNPVKAAFSLSSNATVYEGVKYELEDLVSFVPDTGSVQTQKEINAFVKANKALVKEYLDALYTFTKEDVASDSFTLKMTKKSAEEVAAAEKKYAGVLGTNVTITPPTGEEFTCAVTVKPITNNELVACDETKTFHVKKAKALKAKKTFQMKADYVKVEGSASYFKKSGNSKIAIARDGKVTVKKGLKKGTYKVKIKVIAPSGSNQLTDSKVLKVKVVK